MRSHITPLDIMSSRQRRIRRAVACGLAGLLACTPAAFSAVTPAAFATTANITVTNLAQSGNYLAYRIMYGTVVGSDGDAKLGDVKIDAGNKAAVLAALEAVGTDTSKISSDAQQACYDIMDLINGLDADKRQAFANALAKEFQNGSYTAAAAAAASSGTVTFSGLETGYYLVMSDTADAGLADGEAMTSAMLLTLDDDGITATGKMSTPTVDKKVKSSTDADYADTADAGLVDGLLSAVTYQITGTMPSNIGEFTSYKYVFTDKLPTGFDLTDAELSGLSATVKIDGTDVTDRFTLAQTTDEATHTSTLTWSCDDILDLGVDITSESKIVVEYTAKMGTDDVNRIYASDSTLSEAPVNTAHITFSNNPYTSGDGTSETPDDEVVTYTYNLNLKKVGDDGATALAGAKFTLTDDNGTTRGMEITANDDGTFDFTGLESGVTYTLTETTVPSGYRSISPIKFTIEATTDADGKTVTSITASESSDPSNAATFTASDATVGVTVVNTEGSALPQTGDVGFWLMVGGAVVLLTLSGAALVRRGRRKESADEA